MAETPPTPLPEKDYEAIEAAVMETARGRWFLAEFAHRNRSADTRVLLDAISRLETVVKRERSIDDVDALRLELVDMKTAIERTKQEIADMRVECGDQGQVGEATAELDAIVVQTEQATQDILNAAEAVQEIAWTLRESGADPDNCETLDNNATEIYTACSFQDLTGQRTKKVVDVLRYLESHINRMIEIWGVEDIETGFEGKVVQPDKSSDVRPDAHLLNGPQLEGRGIKQDDVDELFGGAPPPEKDTIDLIEVDIDWDQADIFETSSFAGGQNADAPVEADLRLVETDDASTEDNATAESTLSSDWYDEQIESLVDEDVAVPPEDLEPVEVDTDDVAGDLEVAAQDVEDEAEEQSGNDPTAHLNAGERLSLFS